MRTELRRAAVLLMAALTVCFLQIVGTASPAHASGSPVAVGIVEPTSVQTALGGSVPLAAWVQDLSPECLGFKDCKTPTGTVEFSLEGGGQHQTLADLTLSPVAHFHARAGTGTISAVVTLPAGTYELTAHYLGDGIFGKHHKTIAFTVAKGSVKATLTQNSNSTAKGHSVLFTAMVGGNSHAPSPKGTITFYDNGHPLATRGVLPTSALLPAHATLTTSALSAGVHTMTATYNGDANYPASTSGAVKHVVKTSIPSINPCLLITCTASSPPTSGSPAPSNTSCGTSGGEGHAAGDCGVGNPSGPASTASGSAAGSPGAGTGGGSGADPGAGADAGATAEPGSTMSGTVVAGAAGVASGAAGFPANPQSPGGSHTQLWLTGGIVLLLLIAALLFLAAWRRRTESVE